MWACVIPWGHSHLFGEITELLQGFTLVSCAIALYNASHQSPTRAMWKVKKQQWSVVAYNSCLYSACVLSPAKVENLEDVWLHNNYQVFWHSLDSEGLRFRNMHFLHPSALTHSLPLLQTLIRSSLSSPSFLCVFYLCADMKLEKSPKPWRVLVRPVSFSLCKFLISSAKSESFILIDACMNMHADTCTDIIFSLFTYFGTRTRSAPYVLAKLSIICLLFPLTDPLARSGNSLAHHNCISQKWHMCF